MIAPVATTVAQPLVAPLQPSFPQALDDNVEELLLSNSQTEKMSTADEESEDLLEASDAHWQSIEEDVINNDANWDMALDIIAETASWQRNVSSAHRGNLTTW